MGFAAASGPGRAQTGQSDTAKVPVPLTIDAAAAPVGDASARYRAAMARTSIRIAATYARSITGDLPLDAAYRPPRQTSDRNSGPIIAGTPAMIVVIVLLVILLALWLRFGGSGTLLSGTPGDLRQKPVAPDGWRMGAEQDLPLADILAQIAAMPDRRAAMVRLLRHCLLQAGAATETRFARSDTEREALRRLPEGWAGRKGLAGILTATELAHYGGREVSQDALSHCLAIARTLFANGRAAHA